MIIACIDLKTHAQDLSRIAQRSMDRNLLFINRTMKKYAKDEYAPTPIRTQHVVPVPGLVKILLK